MSSDVDAMVVCVDDIKSPAIDESFASRVEAAGKGAQLDP